MFKTKTNFALGEIRTYNFAAIVLPNNIEARDKSNNTKANIEIP